jgi:hypothetical protein
MKNLPISIGISHSASSAQRTLAGAVLGAAVLIVGCAAAVPAEPLAAAAAAVVSETPALGYAQTATAEADTAGSDPTPCSAAMIGFGWG